MKKFLFILLLVGVCFGQEIEWFISYNGSGEESMGHFIIECEDGGFLQVGETYFFSDPVSTKLYVVKTNIEGSKIWDNEIYIGGHNLGNSILESTDGYLIFGGLNQNSSIIKLQKDNGAVIFNKSYDNGGTDAFENGVETPNGIVAVGYNNSEDPYNAFYTEGEGFISFLDHEGNEVTSFSIGDYISQAYRIKYFDNELYISGLTEEALDYKMIKMSLEGDIIWHYEYGGSGSDHCFAMDMNEQGEIFLAGHTTSNTENWDVYTIKLNNEGEVIWENKTGNPRGFNPLYIHDEAWGVHATNDGGCVTVAGTGDEYEQYSECIGDVCSDIWNAYIIKYDSDGLTTWEETFSPLDIGVENYDWAAEAIDLTTDGGAIIAVDNGQFGFLKLNNIQSNENNNSISIEGRWIIPVSENDPGNTMYEFLDGLRYTYYCSHENGCDSTYWNSLDTSDAIPNPNPYTFSNDTLTINLFFGNTWQHPISFECDGNVVTIGDTTVTWWSSWWRVGYDINECEGQELALTNTAKHSKTFKLIQNYPNPFNPITSLTYELPNNCSVNITIYDMMGRIVKTLVNSSQTAGFKSIQWNATNDKNEPVSAGLYLYTIQAGKYRQTKKMVLLK